MKRDLWIREISCSLIALLIFYQRSISAQQWFVSLYQSNPLYIEVIVDLSVVPNFTKFDNVGCEISFYDAQNNFIGEDYFNLTGNKLPKMKPGMIYRRILPHKFHNASTVVGKGLDLVRGPIGNKFDDFSSATTRVAGESGGWISSTTLYVHIRAYNNEYFTAENGGGGEINADRSTPWTWETFTLTDLNGGQLMSGDRVYFRTMNAFCWVAENGGGGRLLATGTRPGEWGTFIIDKQHVFTEDDDEIRYGSFFTLRTQKGYYIVAEHGGGAEVNANRFAVGGWEVFTLVEPSQLVLNQF
ncbi:MAG: hypothetical protein KDI38_12775 [Calditrichaeota bacterium]|nr:hypothetical protein [Calditrichota bacterium]MCB9087927.1 hypothetical protein [Calditrichia bacterium]